MTIVYQGVVSGRVDRMSLAQNEMGLVSWATQPDGILTKVLLEGLVIAGIGGGSGILVGLALARGMANYIAEEQLPGALLLTGSAAAILAAAVIASAIPAARAARVDAVQPLRAE